LAKPLKNLDNIGEWANVKPSAAESGVQNVNSIDTSVEVAGLRFKSPVLVSSSEWAFNISQCENLLHRPIGGIITKTFTSNPSHRIRLRPYQFPLKVFGNGYGGTLFSLAAPHVEDMERVFVHILRMANACHDASVY
jgi:hypothetical protein